MKKQYLQPQLNTEKIHSEDVLTASGLQYGELDQDYINQLAREELDNFTPFW